MTDTLRLFQNGSIPTIVDAAKKPYRTIDTMTDPKNPFYETGLRLKWHRDFMGMEQSEYAGRAGVNPKTYSNWETGYAQVSLKGARALRKTYGLTLDFIIEGEPGALPATLFRSWSERSLNK